MIGREKEQKELLRRYRRNQAEFIAVYGRRRVGKTFLIDETFREKITFRHAGLSPVEGNRSGQMKAQLEQFYYSLLKHGMKKSHLPQSWLEAFFMLEMLLQEKTTVPGRSCFWTSCPGSIRRVPVSSLLWKGSGTTGAAAVIT